MGRPYTEEERAELKLRIKETASKMFMHQGFKDFRIQELTKQVGISLGGFYTFYKDKEALYEEILRDEKNRIRKKIIMIIKEENQTPKDFFTDLANVLIDKTNTNKFYTNEYSSLLETLVWNDDPVTAEDNLHFIQQIRKVWINKGITISASDEELASAVATLAILCTNKDKIGAGFQSWYQVIEKMLLEHL
ncbi:transcriptional regulator, TetR family [Anaerocolumna jejuensis DSM 15929]|uniref:Transcriptional regulator, TetR family n=1 Tax=Anaerocolumna jejuensis DSM 15929 TaxID=1121322 RepID=A0A1M6XEU5_9FIRM|nr:TetR/AcrR family transcriptional regulator [Anaerocolumna jejuensis]SHL04438.1 transcriptional regulator, TetR family [Anaerocolumna jejuensis DSM 15929]